jgi:ketopantoate reductase
MRVLETAVETMVEMEDESSVAEELNKGGKTELAALTGKSASEDG